MTISRRCIECFNLGILVPRKTICGDCLKALFPDKLPEVVLPPSPLKVEVKSQFQREEDEVLILLENAPQGMEMSDFPDRLHSALAYLTTRRHVRHPKGQTRYFLAKYVAPVSRKPDQKKLSA